MGLTEYKRKRDFRKTPEPKGELRDSSGLRRFVVHKHAARRLHYDFRLELDGVLKSWAVPKGPSLDPQEKRLAVQVEDHPLAYASFEGIIPRDEYGGGTVMVWDTGEWEPVGDPVDGYRKGNLKFQLHGVRLSGQWALARMRAKRGEATQNWLLIKKKDAFSRAGSKDALLEEHPQSALTGRTMDEIAQAADSAVWSAPEETGTVDRARLETTPSEDGPALLTNARRRPQPEKIRPQLAVLADRPPAGKNWLHEIKFDGYRGICIVRDQTVRIFSRTGKDLTKKFSAIAREVQTIGLDNAVLDGEIVVLNPNGATDFQALQNVLEGIQDGVLTYYVFDLPYFQGYDLTRTPLKERKALLQSILSARINQSFVRYSDHVEGAAAEFYHHACLYALEGIISKRADSIYEQKRAKTWIKTKCLNRQEFVIGGYTDPIGARSGFGALLLGYYDSGRLIYAGRVGTGFDEAALRDIRRLLIQREQPTAAFQDPPSGRSARGIHWTRPELVAEVAFSSWTKDGILRQASFKGLREDKSHLEIVREKPQSIQGIVDDRPGRMNVTRRPGRQQDVKPSKPPKSGESVAGVFLSHPYKILYHDQGISKMDLARYYEEISEWILPHIIGRPLTLVRCPNGHHAECFYQKHTVDALPSSIKGIRIKEKRKDENYLYIEDLSGLIALVQLGVLEIHPWGGRIDRIEQPDRITFDLDPGTEVDWSFLVETAHLLHDRLEELGLRCFVKTSGGKGLHVTIPLVRRNDWEEIRSFAETFTRSVVRDFPDRYVATMTKAKRRGKIFIDYFRNNRGATSVAAYSTRARPGAPVSAPLAWKALDHERGPDVYTLKSLPQHLKGLKKDPWSGFFETRQYLTKAIRKKAGVRF